MARCPDNIDLVLVVFSFVLILVLSCLAVWHATYVYYEQEAVKTGHAVFIKRAYYVKEFKWLATQTTELQGEKK